MMFYGDEETTPEREENELHTLFRKAKQPVTLLSDCVRILYGDSDVGFTNPPGNSGTQNNCGVSFDLLPKKFLVDVNQLDSQGNTPLCYIVLHVNRGLRFHVPAIPEIQRLVDLGAAEKEIEALCIKIDSDYQRQVHECIKLLLHCGANPNFIPEKCPSLAHETEWTKAYENKLLQQEGRWHFFMRGLKMDNSKYCFFDPLNMGHVLNELKVNIFHLAAWRGSCQALQLLIDAGANVNSFTDDGRSVLHFMYQYCNKPADLIESTKLLLQYGISVRATDSFGQMSFQTILRHSLISRSYVKYLANSYTEDYIITDPCRDHYQDEVIACVELLLAAGQNVTHVNRFRDGALHILMQSFTTSLEDAEFDFQIERHYLVPYQFKILPVTRIIQCLLKFGYQVDVKDSNGRTVLHSLIVSLHNILFHEKLNSVTDFIQCVNTLFEYGANTNAQFEHSGQTSAHILAQLVKQRPEKLAATIEILKVLLARGLDLNIKDRFGKAFLHYILQSKADMKAFYENKDLERCLILALRSGADPNQDCPDKSYNFPFYVREFKTPLSLLLRGHVYHHQPTPVSSQSPVYYHQPTPISSQSHVFQHQPTPISSQSPVYNHQPTPISSQSHVSQHQPTPIAGQAQQPIASSGREHQLISISSQAQEGHSLSVRNTSEDSERVTVSHTNNTDVYQTSALRNTTEEQNIVSDDNDTGVSNAASRNSTVECYGMFDLQDRVSRNDTRTLPQMRTMDSSQNTSDSTLAEARQSTSDNRQRAITVISESIYQSGASGNDMYSTSSNMIGRETSSRGAASHNGFLRLVEILASTMSRVALQQVFYEFCHTGVCGVFCEKQCPVFQLLYEMTTQPASLSQLCRLRIWAATGSRLNERHLKLPLPKQIIRYVLMEDIL